MILNNSSDSNANMDTAIVSEASIISSHAPSTSHSLNTSNIRILGEVFDANDRSGSPSNSTCGVDGDESDSSSNTIDDTDQMNHDDIHHDRLDDMRLLEESNQPLSHDHEEYLANNQENISLQLRSNFNQLPNQFEAIAKIDDRSMSMNHENKSINENHEKHSRVDSMAESNEITASTNMRQLHEEIPHREDHQSDSSTDEIEMCKHEPRNLRLEGIRFLRELFFLSRNFHWERR